MRSLQSRTSAPSAELLTWLLLATATSAACGLAISRQATAIAVAIPAISLGAGLLPLMGPGGFVGFALVAASNAVPGLDLTSYSVGQADGTDVAFAAILGFAVVRRLSAPAAARSHPVNRLLWIWA